MNFPDNFNYIGNVDISELARLVDELTEEDWHSDSYRQNRYEAHRETQTIPLVYDADFRHSHPTRLPALQKYQQAIYPILELVADHFENTDDGQALIKQHGLGYFIRTSLVRLVHDGVIPAHQDGNFSLTHSHRVHVPVVTNEDVEFTVGEQTIVMTAGEVIEINNRRAHSVSNKGELPRIHLILDFVLPGEMCCCGKRHHPATLCSPQSCKQTDTFKIPCNCYPAA